MLAADGARHVLMPVRPQTARGSVPLEPDVAASQTARPAADSSRFGSRVGAEVSRAPATAVRCQALAHVDDASSRRCRVTT